MAEINSAKDLREALAALIRDYVRHLDFDAPTEITTVRVEASGPGLTVIYAEVNEGPPQLSVAINSWPPPTDADVHPEPGGRFGRKGG